MPIRLAVRELLDAQPALQRLGAEKLPIKVAYNLARLMRVIQPELDDFYKQRNDLVKQYGVTRPATDAERTQHGDEVTEVPKDKIEEFRNEINELADEKITLDREPLKLGANFPDISAADIIALGALLADDEDEQPSAVSSAPAIPSIPRPA
jgi:hypothetical protein